MYKLLLGVCALSLCSVSSGALASVVIDQNDEVTQGGFSYLNQPEVTEQTFTAGFNNSVGGSILLDTGYGAPASAQLTMQLWTGSLNDAGATMLAGGTITAASGGWNDVFWNQVALTVGNVYSLRFTADSNLVSDYSNGNVYTAGGAYYGGFDYGAYGYDLNFRAYANDAAGAVPEPASWALMLGGFGAIGGAMRSRRKAAVSFG